LLVDRSGSHGQFGEMRWRRVTLREGIGIVEVIARMQSDDNELWPQRQRFGEHPLILAGTISAMCHAVDAPADAGGEQCWPRFLALDADSIRVRVADGHDVGMRKRFWIAIPSCVMARIPGIPSTESGTQSGVGSRRTPNRDAARTCSMISQITKEITTTTSRAQTLAPQRRHRLTVTIVFGSLNGVETGLLVVAQQPGVGL